nr:DUF4229 domain-containing protein [Arthrobacter roseus]
MKFTLLRSGLIIVCFALFIWLGAGLWVSAIAAVIIPLCITYLFFRTLRNEAAATLQRRFRDSAPPVRNKAELSDADAEDSIDPNARIDMARKPSRASERPTDDPANYRPDSYGPGQSPDRSS